jgi:hypothetical protein
MKSHFERIFMEINEETMEKHEPQVNMNGGGVWSVAMWVCCSCGWNEEGGERTDWWEHLRRNHVCRQ